MDALEKVRDVSESAVSEAKNLQLYGGIAGLVVGATVGGLYASNVSFNFIPKVGNQVSSIIGFLLGAGIYSYGLSSKVKRDELRSLAQVSGIVIAGMNLGKLFASFGLPTFDLATEDSDWVGYTGDGRVIGLQADTEEEFGQNYKGRVVGQEQAAEQFEAHDESEEEITHDHVPDYSPETYNPTMTDNSMGGQPSWTSGASNPTLPIYDAAVQAGMVMPMSGSVTQWYGSAEGISHNSHDSTVGYNFSNVEGIGSVIGQ